jgi:excisionase family DNA binding protein
MTRLNHEQQPEMQNRGWALQSVLDAVPHLSVSTRGVLVDVRREHQEKRNETNPSMERCEQSDIITVDEAADLLRTNRKTVYEQIQLGLLPGCRRIGRSIRLSRKKLMNWLDEGQG